MDLIRHPIVFLHLPKTAGQTVHNALVRAIGPERISPVRVHTQVRPESTQFPPGHALYSGHLDWDRIDVLPPGRFTFTVLRNPFERIASFYFYLRSEALRLPSGALLLPENIGRARALDWTADDYFFGGEPQWQSFIRDHYDNFYCAYFASRRMRGGAAIRALPPAEAVARARRGLAQLDGVFDAANLGPLEAAMADRYGFRLTLAGRRDNAGDGPRGAVRWPRLLEVFGTDSARRRISDYAERDAELVARRLVRAV